MALGDTAMPTRFDVYRPFGAPAAFSSGNKCRLIEQFDEGRRPSTALLNSLDQVFSQAPLQWTHYMDFESEVDVRDALVRVPSKNEYVYADGDEIRIPDANGTRYVVVFVTPMGQGTQLKYKRAYLLRHDAVWEGTGMT